MALDCASIDVAALEIICDFVNFAVSRAKSASSIFDNLDVEAIWTLVSTFIRYSILFSAEPNFALVLAIVSIAVSIFVSAEDALVADDTDIVEPAEGELVEAWACIPISATSSPEILIVSLDVCVSWIWPLKVTELAVDIVAPVASVCPVKYVPATLEAIIMSAPLELTNWRFPSVLADATISPIAALFIAVIVDDNVLALEKLIAFPFILIFDAAEEAWELFTVIVTKLFPDAVTLVEEVIELIATAFAAADELVDAPTDVSFIFI